MSASTAWFRRFYTLLLMCFAVAPLNVGCCSTKDTSSSSGAASSKPGSSWNPFAPEPKKVQTTSDFIGLKRPE